MTLTAYDYLLGKSKASNGMTENDGTFATEEEFIDDTEAICLLSVNSTKTTLLSCETTPLFPNCLA